MLSLKEYEEYKESFVSILKLESFIESIKIIIFIRPLWRDSKFTYFLLN